MSPHTNSHHPRKPKPNPVKKNAKAGVSGLAGTGITGVVVYAMQDNVVTTGEWLLIGLSLVGTVLAVWAVPNKDPEGAAQDESVQPPGA